jgi:glycosyltransferase involved in cell wall biosynthesis
MKNVNRKVLLAAGTGFLRAYAGTLYLARQLVDHGCDLQTWVVCSEEEAAEYESLGIGAVCRTNAEGLWILRKLAAIFYRFRLLFEMLRARKVIITESTYLFEAVLAKLIGGKRVIFIQFSQELQLASEYPDFPRIQMMERLRLVRYARRIVDVEPNRARVRMEKLHLSEMPLVLRNTMPKSSMPPRDAPGSLQHLAGIKLPKDVPILLHMGGIGREKPLERVIEAIAVCSKRVFFLAFCNGSADQIDRLNDYAAANLKSGSFSIVGPRKRDELLAAAWEADVGIVDYSPSVENTSNQKYCAPTKLYEFMAIGLAIVGSDNNSLREIIDQEAIGACAESGTIKDLSQALEKVVCNVYELHEMKRRSAIAFTSKYCYEELCLPVIKEIIELLDK